jgi:hypothetical protein
LGGREKYVAMTGKLCLLLREKSCPLRADDGLVVRTEISCSMVKMRFPVSEEGV